MPSASGSMLESVTIRVYEGDSQEVLVRDPRDVNLLSGKELLAAIQNTGIAGMGGATFPAHVKLGVPPDTPVDTLLVNAAECEPFLTCDHRVMVERAQDVMRGIGYAMRASGATRTIIGIEDNKPDAISALQSALPQDGSVAVTVMQTKYPQGAEEMIIFSLLGREVPAGSRPASVGVLMNNVMTLAYLGRLLPAGEGMIERVITVAGPGVKKPGNYVVPLGTPLRFLLEYTGIHSGAHEIILGGPMMGLAISSLDVAITKGTSGVLAFADSQLAAETRRSYACIKCGECLSVCPKHLNPSQLGMLAAKREYALMAASYHLDRCFECGCCSYVCPSHIPLVQQFRIAKAINREKATA